MTGVGKRLSPCRKAFALYGERTDPLGASMATHPTDLGCSSYLVLPNIIRARGYKSKRVNCRQRERKKLLIWQLRQTLFLWYTVLMHLKKTALLLLVPWTATALSLTRVCELDRPPEPASLSSLTFVSNGTYWSSTDWKPVLYELKLKMSPEGVPAGVDVTRLCALEKATDVEGVARDPLRGTIWAADEIRKTVCEYDPSTGRKLGKLEIPPIFRNCRKTFGFESLSIRADGLEMWLANEESLLCDGSVSTPKIGSTVRIARFTRVDGNSPWHPDGQWAYICDSMAGSAPLDGCRSGLTSLCVLEDGTLLALEREYSFKPLPSMRCRIYSIDRKDATDISALESIAPGVNTFTPVAKNMLYDANTGFAIYEGMAPAPVEPDGSRLILLVSDGDKMMVKKLLVLRLKP